MKSYLQLISFRLQTRLAAVLFRQMSAVFGALTNDLLFLLVDLTTKEFIIVVFTHTVFKDQYTTYVYTVLSENGFNVFVTPVESEIFFLRFTLERVEQSTLKNNLKLTQT